MTSDHPYPSGKHKTARHSISLSDEEWRALGELVGESERSALIRALVKRYIAGRQIPARARWDWRRDA